MRLKKLYLQNYRCYERCELTLHDDLTVLIAPNGMGKTAILDAIALGFGLLYRGFPSVKSNSITQSDIRIVEQEKLARATAISFFAEHQGRPMFWGRTRKSNAAVDNNTLQKLKIEGRSIVSEEYLATEPTERLNALILNREILTAFNQEAAFEIPLVVYYGTDRAVRTDVKRRRGFKKSFSRFDALTGALDASAGFRGALEWFNAMEEQERREKIARKDYSYKRPDLEAVRSAICQLLPGQHKNPRIEMRPLRFVIDHKDGRNVKTLKLTQLSDGYRIVLAMVMDLARRMVEANPQPAGKSPFSAQSIVLIDEIDLHLHPEWQQNILVDLRRVFPNTQFIVTTHSPQVLTTVPPECLRKITFDKKGVKIETGFEFLLGARADHVLEQVLGVSARPESLSEVKDLRRYKELVEANEWNNPEAVALRHRLNDWGRGYEEELEKIDVDIKVRQFRQQKSR
jgi:predicted ATP-binding protein involved in virulence